MQQYWQVGLGIEGATVSRFIPDFSSSWEGRRWELQKTRAWLDEVGAEDMSLGCVSSLVTFISESLLPYEVCGFTPSNTPCHDVHLDTDPETPELRT